MLIWQDLLTAVTVMTVPPVVSLTAHSARHVDPALLSRTLLGPNLFVSIKRDASENMLQYHF